MRKILVLFALMIGTLAMAQDKTAEELKNEGNEALRAKKYKEALAMYEKAISMWGEGEVDGATVYNAATCARRTKQYDKAKNYLEQSQELGYKADLALYYEAAIEKTQGNEDEYVNLMKKLIKQYPNSRNHSKYQAALANHMNKKAQVPYQKAAEIQSSASGLAGQEYVDKMEEAIPYFEKAKVEFQKTLEVDPDNSSAKQIIANIETAVKTFEDYKASLQQ